MGQQEYDNFKRLIKEWLDSHPDEYADFVEEMNDKKFKGFFNIFNTAVRLVETPREFAPRGQATMTPVGKTPLPLCGKIELTPENDCLSGAFFIVLSIVLTGGLTQKTNT